MRRGRSDGEFPWVFAAWVAAGTVLLITIPMRERFGQMLMLASALAVCAIGMQWWARASMRRFDRAIGGALAGRGSPEAVLARAWGMRLFAPRAAWAERCGTVALATGEPLRARRAFARALDGEIGDGPLGPTLGYAHACYALGDDAEAIYVYRRIEERFGTLPRVATNLAHALHRHGATADEVRVAIEAARATGIDEEEREVLALIHALVTHRRDALGRGVATSERLEALRRALWRAHGSRRPSRREGRVIALRR